MVSRTSHCDVCHDVHFWYCFNSEGKIIHFSPIYLTKAYNQEWTENDLQMFRQRILNRSFDESFEFNPDLDAVTSATISSSLVFNSINKTKEILSKLRKKGVIEK